MKIIINGIVKEFSKIKEVKTKTKIRKLDLSKLNQKLFFN